ncbi:unnamed protein product [Aphis gossypii]|uniref:Uncharacterized protein n=1 Tax=Aphis gossypii TaxID=80765 RepID=A0A9P0NJT5_APHGO|nr:unnamed protein product [Aphis gossypii]
MLLLCVLAPVVRAHRCLARGRRCRSARLAINGLAPRRSCSASNAFGATCGRRNTFLNDFRCLLFRRASSLVAPLSVATEQWQTVVAIIDPNSAAIRAPRHPRHLLRRDAPTRKHCRPPVPRSALDTRSPRASLRLSTQITSDARRRRRTVPHRSYAPTLLLLLLLLLEPLPATMI